MFWASWVAQTAPGMRPYDMWQVGIDQYVGMFEQMRQKRG